MIEITSKQTVGADFHLFMTANELFKLLNQIERGEYVSEKEYITLTDVNHVIAWIPNITKITVKAYGEHKYLVVSFNNDENVEIINSGIESVLAEKARLEGHI